MGRPAGIVFDLDGTLLDTLVSLAGAFNKALRTMGYPPHPVQDYRQIIGDGAETAARRALPANSPKDVEITRCLTLFKMAYQRSWREANVYTGIPDLLTGLPKDIPLAVLSNKDDLFTRKCVDHFFPGRFHLAIGASNSIKHKPDLSGALHIAKQLKTDTHLLWMIGDTSTDMRTALGCGMEGIGVNWGFRDRKELICAGASHVIEAPVDLLNLLSD